MNTIALALRLVTRDFRAGELRVLAAAIVLAVASVGTVAFFADRVKTGLAQQANLLLGADLMISGDRPLPAAFADEARRRGLATSPAIRFNSMTTHNLAQAKRLADEVVFLDGGCVTEHTAAEEFFRAPRSLQAMTFLEGERL